MKRRIFLLIVIVIAVSSSIFAQVPEDELWKNKILYVSASAGLGPIFGSDGTVLGGNLSPIHVDWQITRFLSLGTGLNFYFSSQAEYTAPKQTDTASGIVETYGGMEAHILFPLLLKYNYRPGIFSFEIGGGPYVAPVAMNTTVKRTNDNGYTVSEGYGKNLFSAGRNNPFGFVACGSFGVKVWQGILFLDLRYLMDFAETTVKFNGEKIGEHRWNMFAFNIGYKYGFLNSRY